MPGGHLLSFDRDSRFNACWTRGQIKRCSNFSSNNMDSDEECDACAAVIVVARCYDKSRRTTERLYES